MGDKWKERRYSFWKIKTIFPSSQIIYRFNGTVFPIDNMIKNNEIQSRTLTTIRDALLPKLLSGEIRAKDAEKFVEKANG